jgi:hypothetical protein
MWNLVCLDRQLLLLQMYYYLRPLFEILNPSLVSRKAKTTYNLKQR